MFHISVKLMLSISLEHIRYATPSQLARLFKTSNTVTSRWGSGVLPNDRTLRKATAIAPKEILLAGIRAKQEDARIADRYQKELSDILAALEVT